MVTFKNKNNLNNYTKKVNNFQEGELCYCEDEDKIYKFLNGEWIDADIKAEGKGLEISMYELNQQIVSQMPNIKEEDYDDILKIIEDYRISHQSSYYMILCKEISYYTIFVKNNLEELAFEEAVFEYCLETGDVKAISPTEDGMAIEIWIVVNGEAHAFYLFDYSMGIINFN